MFTRLQTKLAVLFASLFSVTLLLGGIAVYAAISDNATRMVRRELEVSGVVFDRVWELRATQLRDGANLLARDFGFREAFATRDDATIRSALDNLRDRLGLHRAFIVGVDGAITGLDVTLDDAQALALWSALDSAENAAGVLEIDSMTYQAISAPILSPILSGWVVFATRLDDAEMKRLEALSAIPLEAVVLRRDGYGTWSAGQREATSAAAHRFSLFIESSLETAAGKPRELDGADGRAIAVVKPLAGLGEGAQAALLLRYPLAKALAPYQPLFLMVIAIGVFGVALAIAGSWMLARSLTRPIQALDNAALRLRDGEDVSVAVETRDEIGRLAVNFNAMASGIRAREKTITHLALHDAETDLRNRQGLKQLIDAPRDRHAGITVVAALGVDRFHHVRSAIGYGLANKLLREIAARLTRAAPNAHLGRIATSILGLVYEARDLDDARGFAAALQSTLAQPIRLDRDTIDAHLTIGIVAKTTGETADTLIDQANIALDQARAGRRKIAVFDSAAYGDPARNLSLTSEMMTSIASGAMSIYLQPKYDIRKGAVTGAEALVRWRHPHRGMLPPDLFVGMAEETGHIRPLTDWVLAQAIAAQAALRARGHNLSMSVNISGRLMDDQDFADNAIDAITAAGAEICMEITETAVIESPDVALRIIDRYAAAGIAISIDDYGSGLSSLAYLKQISAHELKIDKSFVMSLAEGHRDALLVKSTVDLAHSLGLKVTAEGVETAEALAMLQTMGCDIAQGYFIARPMPLEDFARFMETAGRGSAVESALRA
ncbi:MAG: EAL domain-containing protein [Hyphomonadaceae bacterium]|nr:EAL domain-containing protein [Hyphomonadaceae bacterium]